jgi:amino acid transporter
MKVVDHSAEKARPGRLRTGAVGTAGVVFVVVAGAAPLTGLAGNVPLGLSLGNGVGLPGAYVVVGLILLAFSAGFAALSRHVVNAGAFYAYVEFGLGRAAGRAAAYLATIGYNASVTSLAAAFAYFASSALRTQTGLDLPWEPLAVAAIVLAGVLNHAGIAVSSRLLALLMVLEVAVVVLVDIAIMADGAHFSVEVFAPRHVFGAGLSVALLFAVLSFAGFEATAIFAEESRRPRRTVGVATYAVVILMTGLFIWSSWAVIASFDGERALLDASADTGGFLFGVADRHLGGWSVQTLQVLVVTSFLASVIAVHNMAARYLFSLGRSRLLPAWLAGTHARRGTPHRAGLVQVAVSVVVLVAFSVTGGEPLTEVVPALAGLFTMTFLALMAATSFAAFRAFRTRLPRAGTWSTVVAPLVSGVLLTATTGLLVANYDLLTGTTSPFVLAQPWIMFGLALALTVGHRLMARRSAPSEVSPVATDPGESEPSA